MIFTKKITEFYSQEENQVTAVDAFSPYNVQITENLSPLPAVWFRPQEVWEIRGADLTISPVHSTGLNSIEPNRGISLRFPRFVSMRRDKSLEDATTVEEIIALYKSQRHFLSTNTKAEAE